MLVPTTECKQVSGRQNLHKGSNGGTLIYQAIYQWRFEPFFFHNDLSSSPTKGQRPKFHLSNLMVEVISNDLARINPNALALIDDKVAFMISSSIATTALSLSFPFACLFAAISILLD